MKPMIWCSNLLLIIVSLLNRIAAKTRFCQIFLTFTNPQREFVFRIKYPFEKIMSRLLEPTRDSILICAISAAESRFQGALFAWYVDKIEKSTRNQECNQNSDASVKD